MNENKTKILLSAETEMCPYWDTESNRPKHTCHDCAEPDNHLSVMIEGVRYCLLDFDIAGEICRGNVPDTNVGKNDRWIPVTERLPEEGKNVLGWIERDKWDNFDKPTKAEECAIGWQIEGRWHFDGYGSKGTRCIAWRPLPEPYTPDSHPADPWDGVKPHAEDGFVAKYCEPYKEKEA